MVHAESTGADEAERSPKQFEFGKWYPIETAPKGRKVLVSIFRAHSGRHTFCARYWKAYTLEAPAGFDDTDGFEHDGDDDYFFPAGWYEEIDAEDATANEIYPTHWMPLPPSPTASEGK